NLLLGRAADSELTVNMDERTALEALSRLLAAKRPVETQRRILQARVGVARAVEDMVDKNLKVDVLRLEPVSLVVRSLGRLMNALGGGPVYNADAAAAARINTLTAERALEAYDAQRADQAARLRAQLAAARSELNAKKDSTDPLTQLRLNELAASVFTLEAGLLAIGENPDAGAPAGSGEPPAKWSELQARLADAEQALAPRAVDGAPDVQAPEVNSDPLPSAAYARLDYAKQTLGHEKIDKTYAEGWIEIRLKNPNTPPGVLLELSKLRYEKAQRIREAEKAGATSQAKVIAAEFESDVDLLRWAQAQIAHPGSGTPPKNLDAFILSLRAKLGGERERMVALLGLKPDTTLESLMNLVPEADTSSSALPGLADKLITDIRQKQIEVIRRTLFENG